MRLNTDRGSPGVVAGHSSRVLPDFSTLRIPTGLRLPFTLAGALIVIAVLGPVLWPKDPLAIDLLARLQPPSLDSPLGTDQFGRDVLARFLAGARISLL